MFLEKKEIPQDVSMRIESLKWFAIALIVVVHAFSAYHFASNFEALKHLKITFSTAFLFTEDVLSLAICFGVVPMFFVVSGYLEAMRPKPYKKSIYSKFQGLFMPFLLWSAIYIIFYIFLFKPYFGTHISYEWLENGSISQFFKSFFGDYKSHFSGVSSRNIMIGYHLWFLRDLFIIMMFAPILKFLITRFSLLYFICLFGCFVINVHPIVGADALLFYSIGVLWALKNVDILKLCDDMPFWLLGVVSIAFIYDCYIDELKHIIAWFCRILALILLLKLSLVFTQNKKIFALTKRLAPYSFFMYVAHAPTFGMFVMIWLTEIFDVESDFGLFSAVILMIIIQITLTTLLAMILKKYTPKTFSFLNGTRV